MTGGEGAVRRVRSGGPEEKAFQEAIARARSGNYVSRLWGKDATLWKNDESHRRNIEGALGWLTAPAFVRERLTDLQAFANDVREEFDAVVVLGMGGSSLCPEVLRRSIGSAKGFPELRVLDSTVPAAISQLEERLNIQRTLFIVASKSGSTTEPQMFYRYFRGRVEEVKGDSAGENFIAITDPGTQLEREAAADGFRRTFVNPSDIGGRYSALSLFGMVPAALAGIDVTGMLRRADEAARESSDPDPEANYAAQLGLILGTYGRAGRDKLTIIASPPVDSVGLWIEQLIAESTGKEGKGLVPVAGEALGPPEGYGDDRLFVWIHTAGFEDAETEDRLDALAAAGHPVLEHRLANALDLGSEFFVWEIATAICGAVLEINPFDQPNVQESKDNTRRLLELYVEEKRLPQPPLISEGDGLKIFGTSEDGDEGEVVETLRRHFDSVRARDYVAITQYIAETPEHDVLLDEIRMLIARSRKVATTTGYGPRFLHSTGQLHKGGPANGVFLQITADDAVDLPIPEQPFGFSILKDCQALGDFESLVNRQRRSLRVHLSANVEGGLKQLAGSVRKALDSR